MGRFLAVLQLFNHPHQITGNNDKWVIDNGKVYPVYRNEAHIEPIFLDEINTNSLFNKYWYSYSLEPYKSVLANNNVLIERNRTFKKLHESKFEIISLLDSVFNKTIDNKKFSCITAWHSLEHVHELENVIKRFYQILDDDGTLIVAVPNYRSFDANYYKSFWAAYDAPRHLWHFDKKSIKEIFSSHGFRFIKSKPLLFDAYYVSLLSEKYKKSKFRIFNSIVVGTLSNLKAFFTKEYSSNVFVFKKSKTNI